jgi:hypothetical protein
MQPEGTEIEIGHWFSWMYSSIQRLLVESLILYSKKGSMSTFTHLTTEQMFDIIAVQSRVLRRRAWPRSGSVGGSANWIWP